MAESVLLKTVREALLLADPYEVKARLVPAAIVAAPLATAAFVGVQDVASWLFAIGAGALTEGVLLLLAGHLARAMGHGYEEALFKGCLPTNLWLSQESPRSAQQRKQWSRAVLALTGLDVERGDADERHKIIGDAVGQLRVQVRYQEVGGLLQTQVEDYGFGRNLAGLVPIWGTATAVGLFLCLYGAIHLGTSWLAVGVEAVFLAACLLYWLRREPYVRWLADRYAETLLNTAVVLARAGGSEGETLAEGNAPATVSENAGSTE
jgi:hypothetical protein